MFIIYIKKFKKKGGERLDDNPSTLNINYNPHTIVLLEIKTIV